MNTKRSTSMVNTQCSLSVLNPVGNLIYDPIPPAKRLKNLNNKKIGLYWNHKARGDIALYRVKEILSERFKGLRFEWFESEPNDIRSGRVVSRENWLKNIRKSGVEAVIGSTGD